MAWTDAALEELARRIEDAFPPLSREERRIALAVFRELALARAVPMHAIAARTGVAPEAVAGALERWPGVYRDDAGRVVGFWGLALETMPHPIRLEDRTLYGWCAWDTLFLDELVGVELEVESACAATGRPVGLRVEPDGVRGLEPATAVLSFLDPERCDVEDDRVISSFCHHILFFADQEAWREWARGREPQTFCLTVGEGWRLGRMANRLRYGRELGAFV